MSKNKLIFTSGKSSKIDDLITENFNTKNDQNLNKKKLILEFLITEKYQ